MRAIDMAQMRRRVVVSSTIGNALEWFDFTVFGLFAGVIGKLFFPPRIRAPRCSRPSRSSASPSPPVRSAARDRPLRRRVRRKKALVVMITLMAIGTGMLGFLPTCAAIGVAAPLLLLLARLIQGFSAGGELVRRAPCSSNSPSPASAAFYGAFQMVSQSLAFAIGRGNGDRAWQEPVAGSLREAGAGVPFILGILIGPVGYYLRAKVDEPGIQGLSRRTRGAAVPVKTTLGRLFLEHPRELIASFCLIAAGTAINYVGAVFLPAFAATDLKLPLIDAQIGLLGISLANSVLVLGFGALSDRIGRRAVIVPGLIVLHPLLHPAAAAGRRADDAHLWQLQAMGVILGALAGPMPAFMTEIFPVGVRSTGASLMAISRSCCSAGSPLHQPVAGAGHRRQDVAVYYIFFAAVGLVGMAVYRRPPARPAG